MFFKTISTVALLATAVVAKPIDTTTLDVLAPLDLPTVQTVFTAVQEKIDKMVAQVKEFTGDTKQMEPILAASSDILAALNDGAGKISSSPAMGIADALGILGPVGTMASKVDEIVSALTVKKETFDKASVTAVVIQQLQDQRLAADKLAKAIVANLPLPGLIGPIAAPIAKQFTDKLEGGLKAFGAEPAALPAGPAAPATPAPKSGKSPKTPKGKGGKSGGGLAGLLGGAGRSIEDLV